MKDLIVLVIVVLVLLVVSMVLVRSEKFETTPPAGYKFIASDSKKFSKFLKSFFNDKKYMVDGENMYPNYHYMATMKGSDADRIYVGKSLPDDLTPKTIAGQKWSMNKDESVGFFDLKQYGTCIPDTWETDNGNRYDEKRSWIFWKKCVPDKCRPGYTLKGDKCVTK
jgi:hypothetical protein